MKTLGFFIMFFGFVLIIFPEFLAYIIGGFFFILGLHILVGIYMYNKSSNGNNKKKKKNKSRVFNENGEKEVVNFFGYKIYKKE